MPLILPPNESANPGVLLLDPASAARQEIRPVRLRLVDGDRTGGEALHGLLALLSSSPLQVEVGWSSDPGPWDAHIVWSTVGGDHPPDTTQPQLLIGTAARQDLDRRHGVVAEHLPRPLVGVLAHDVHATGSPLIAGQEDRVLLPVARDWRISATAIARVPGLEVLIDAAEAGVHLVHEPAARRLYVVNQVAISPLGLARRIARLLPADDPAGDTIPALTWRTHAHLLLNAWLNTEVYQPASLGAWLDGPSLCTAP